MFFGSELLAEISKITSDLTSTGLDKRKAGAQVSLPPNGVNYTIRGN
jgi:hypothetical protein